MSGFDTETEAALAYTGEPESEATPDPEPVSDEPDGAVPGETEDGFDDQGLDELPAGEETFTGGETIDVDELEYAIATADPEQVDAALEQLSPVQLAALAQIPEAVAWLDDEQISFVEARLSEAASAEPAGPDPRDDPAMFALDVLNRQRAADAEAEARKEMIATYVRDRAHTLRAELLDEFGDDIDLGKLWQLGDEIGRGVVERTGLEGEAAARAVLREAGDRLYPAETETEAVRRFHQRRALGVAGVAPERRQTPAALAERAEAWNVVLADETERLGEPENEAEALRRYLNRRKEG